MKGQAPAARLLDREGAALYLGGVSTDAIDRLINAGTVPIVRLPVSRTGRDSNRRVLIDVRDLDRLIETSKESRE